MNDTSSLLVRLARRLLSTAVLSTALAPAYAQTKADAEAAIPLDRYVLSASRTPQDARYTPSAVTVVSMVDLRTAQVTSLATALSMQPGVVVAMTGAPGGQASVLMRGANSDQTLFLVDGVRMNDRSAAYLNFLGGADIEGIDRLEVLRGPQSTLYGSSAMGGVIRIDTERGSGAAHGSLAATAGSFGTFGGTAAVKGAADGLRYSASFGRFVTDNDLANNDLRRWTGATRLEYVASPVLLVGGTFRAVSIDREEPGSRVFPSIGTTQSGNTLGTVFAEAHVADEFTSRLTLALHRRQYTWRSGSYYAPQSNRREIVDWQNTWSPIQPVEIVAGVNAENSRFIVEGRSDEDRLSAGYVSATVRPTSSVTVTGGVRYDDFKSVGGATTGRVGLAWLPRAGTKLHATYGTGFNAPGTSDRYGVPSWGQIANPNLVPEKSRGWDAGIEQELGPVTVDVTFFHNRFRNLFEWEYVNYVTWEGMTVNRARATTQGVEVATQVRLCKAAKLRANYTYLDAQDDSSGARLTRRPRHTADAELQVRVSQPCTVGAGLHAVGDNINGTMPFAGYTTARAFVSYAVRENLLLKLRVENALDREFEEVYGYPALPRAAYGTVEWRF
ncbi:TonB-dependent receptor [Opitutus sp. ER46]|uniref:TonB-dependent receptor plug domain-containing protein n=1 Tax=Opitutus sp. ER46 TaxID=2161864 RepID=UPI000D300EF4|nr:TonB-dependent receptor [Opitutus sp. ER46]PTX92381.1 TonB-dependent receptor [Opitutus sp. ER46]